MPRCGALLAASSLLFSGPGWVSLARAQAVAESATDGASEPKARAAALDRQAREAFAAGDFQRAAELFSEAYRTLPHPATRYNEAVARERSGQRARAANLLEVVVSELPAGDPRRKDASARLAALGAKLGRLSLSTSEPASASIAFVQGRAAPFVVYLEPGRYPLEVRFPSGLRQRSVELRAGELLRLDVEAPARAAPVAETPPPPPRSHRATWGLVTLGAGAAAGAASAVLGYSTLQAVDDFERSGYTDRAARERAVRLRLLTNVALGACALTSGVGIYLLLTRPDEPQATGSVSLYVGPDRATLRGSF